MQWVMQPYVHTNRPNIPISKYSSADVSILNIIHWISKTYVLILNKILHLHAGPGVECIISIPKTCSLYIFIKYSNTKIQIMTPSLLGCVTNCWLMQTSCFLVSHHLTFLFLVLLLVLADHLNLTHKQCNHWCSCKSLLGHNQPAWEVW